ncbi:MAG: SRPBCC family protein [Ilumatobacteraceae bacterium]
MAEQLVNEFTVNRPIGEAWPVICELERIAPCLPGAQLEEIEGEVYRGNVKVKLGAITTKFKGEASFVERDDDSHRAKLKASGRDTGGRGNASADISAEAEELSPTSTKVTVIADLQITGKVAQFSRGILGDVSKKLMTQFATNLNTMLDEDANGGEVGNAESTPAPDDTAPAGGASAGNGSAGNGSAGGADPTGATATDPTGSTDPTSPTVRRIEGPATEPIDMAGMAGPAVVKRAAPAIVAVLLLLFLLRRRRNR